MSDSLRPHGSDSVWPHPWDYPGKNTGVGCHFLLQCIKVKSKSEVAQSCPTLRDPMDCSLPGSSVHGIFQARVLEWGAIAFTKFISRYNLYFTNIHNKCNYLVSFPSMYFRQTMKSSHHYSKIHKNNSTCYHLLNSCFLPNVIKALHIFIHLAFTTII